MHLYLGTVSLLVHHSERYTGCSVANIHSMNVWRGLDLPNSAPVDYLG